MACPNLLFLLVLLSLATPISSVSYTVASPGEVYPTAASPSPTPVSSIAAASPAVVSLTVTILTILSLAKRLTDSPHLSMALGLCLSSPTATIFLPPDTAFRHSGPPSIPLVRYHVSPRRLAIKTLARGTAIETLRRRYNLTVTSSFAGDSYTFINGVWVDPTPVVDNGSVVIYRVAKPFPVNRSASAHTAPASAKPPQQKVRQVGDFLRAIDCSIMAAFLESQVTELSGSTLFAEVDDAVEEYANFSSDYAQFFKTRVVPRWLSWVDLTGMLNGSHFPNSADGGRIMLTKDGQGRPVLNGSLVVVGREIFTSPSLVVYLVQSKAIRRRPGFFAGGCKKLPVEVDLNKVSEGINLLFGILTTAIFIGMIGLFSVALLASHVVVPGEVPVVVDEAVVMEEDERTGSKPVEKVPVAVPSPELAKPTDMRKKTKLDVWEEKTRKLCSATGTKISNRGCYRALHFTAAWVMRIGVPVGTVYFLLRLFWSALQSIDPKLIWGTGVHIGV